MKRFILLAVMLLGVAQMMGCAAAALAPYDLYEDKRELGTIADDSKIKTNVSNALSAAGYSDKWDISVFCYEGHVFLVGEVPSGMTRNVLDTAHNVSGVRSVEHHWFTPMKRSKTDDFSLATKLRTNLIGADGLVSSRVDTEVNAGRVVLLGMVESESEKGIAIRTARETDGVREVSSLLIIKR